MQAFGRNETLFEPGSGGVVSAELATGNGHFLLTEPIIEISPCKLTFIQVL
jgi:hypothetical protein